jgi:uncharacterized MAPEG superfamily protein
MTEFLAPYNGALTLAVLIVLLTSAQSFVSAFFRNAVHPHPAGATIPADHENSTYRQVRSFENSIENAVLFFPTLFLAVLLQASPVWVYWITLIYLVARAGHWAMYSMKISVLRTVCFAVGFFSTVALAIVTLM